LGSVRTEQIKRIATELITRFHNKFSHDFENNKQLVAMLTKGTTTKVRNKIAEYITHALSNIEPTSSANEEEEQEKQ